jgi:hypothetical protein
MDGVVEHLKTLHLAGGALKWKVEYAMSVIWPANHTYGCCQCWNTGTVLQIIFRDEQGQEMLLEEDSHAQIASWNEPPS